MYSRGQTRERSQTLMKPPNKQSRDWFKTGVHFVFGCGIGLFVAIQVSADEFMHDSSVSELPIIIGVTLLFGVLAAAGLDRFWSTFGRRWWN